MRLILRTKFLESVYLQRRATPQTRTQRIPVYNCVFSKSLPKYRCVLGEEVKCIFLDFTRVSSHSVGFEDSSLPCRTPREPSLTSSKGENTIYFSWGFGWFSWDSRFRCTGRDQSLPPVQDVYGAKLHVTFGVKWVHIHDPRPLLLSNYHRMVSW